MALPRPGRPHRPGRDRPAGQRRRPAPHQLTAVPAVAGQATRPPVPMMRSGDPSAHPSVTAWGRLDARLRHRRCAPAPADGVRRHAGPPGRDHRPRRPRRRHRARDRRLPRAAGHRRAARRWLGRGPVGRRWYQLCWWWMERMRTSPVPLVEKMVLFWHNHFVSGQEKLYDMGLLYTQNQLFRQHALGDYHALVQGMAIDPAMLWYLDNAENVAGREQENFAREVMELFTMGQGNYTEADVISMARAWTGHNVTDRRSLATSSGRPTTTTAPRCSSAARPRTGTGPPPSPRSSAAAAPCPASRFITAKLFSYLAYPIAVTDPLVATLADGFRAADLSILSLVRDDPPLGRLLEPRPPATRSVRNPTEWFVAGMEALGLPPATLHPEWWMEGTGQQLFYPPERGRLEAELLLDLAPPPGWARSGWALATSGGRRTTPACSPASSRQPAATIVDAGVPRASASSTPPPPPAPPSRRGSRAPRPRATRWSIPPNLVLPAAPDPRLPAGLRRCARCATPTTRTSCRCSRCPPRCTTPGSEGVTRRRFLQGDPGRGRRRRPRHHPLGERGLRLADRRPATACS